MKASKTDQSSEAPSGSLRRLVGTEYQLRDEYETMRVDRVTFHRMNSPFYRGEKWAVRRGGYCMNNEGTWEYEPMPSSRTDAFYKRCRFESLEKALAIFDGANTEVSDGER